MKTNTGRYLLLAGAFALICALLALTAPSASAERGGGGRQKSEIWIMDDTSSRSLDDGMNVGDSVAFGYTTSFSDPEQNRGPWLRLECYIDGSLVYFETRAGFEGGYRYGEPFSLGPSLAWPSGAADCEGVLGHMHHKNGRFVTEASVDFDVAA